MRLNAATQSSVSVVRVLVTIFSLTMRFFGNAIGAALRVELSETSRLFDAFRGGMAYRLLALIAQSITRTSRRLKGVSW